MAIDGVNGGATNAALPSPADSTTSSDMDQFEQAFLQYLPQAMSFELSSIMQDVTQTIMEAGDDNTPDPFG